MDCIVDRHFETLLFAKINCDKFHNLEPRQLQLQTCRTLLFQYLSRFVGSGETSFNFKSVISNNSIIDLDVKLQVAFFGDLILHV